MIKSENYEEMRKGAQNPGKHCLESSFSGCVGQRDTVAFGCDLSGRDIKSPIDCRSIVPNVD